MQRHQGVRDRPRRRGNLPWSGGQIVGYPIVDLSPDRRDVRRYVRDLEETMLRAVLDAGVRARGGWPGLNGIWLAPDAQPASAGPPRKLGALGVHLSRWVTSAWLCAQREHRSRGLRPGGRVRNSRPGRDLSRPRARVRTLDHRQPSRPRSPTTSPSCSTARRSARERSSDRHGAGSDCSPRGGRAGSGAAGLASPGGARRFLAAGDWAGRARRRGGDRRAARARGRDTGLFTVARSSRSTTGMPFCGRVMRSSSRRRAPM